MLFRLQKILLWPALIGLSAASCWGIYSAHLLAQPLWAPMGLRRLALFSCAYALWCALVIGFSRRWFVPLTSFAALAWTVLSIGVKPVGAVALFLFSCLVLGRIILRESNPFLPAVLGMALFMTVIGAAIHFPINYPLAYLALFLAPLTNRRIAGRTLAECWDFFRPVERGSRPEYVAAALLGFVMLAQLLSSFKPETGPDGLGMHLFIPWSVYFKHYWGFDFQRIAWALMPMGGDWCFTGVFLLGGESAVKLLNFGVLAILTGMVYSVVGHWLPPGPALVTTALFVSSPLAQLVTGSVFVENIQAAYLFGALVALWQYRESGSSPWLFTSAVLLGSGIATKFGSLAFAAPFVLFAAAEVWRWARRLKRNLSITALTAAGLFLLFALPPYATAYFKSGNPVFPFLNHIFQSPAFDARVPFPAERWRLALGPATPFDVVFHTHRYLESYDGALGFQYLLLAPLSLLLLGRGWPYLGWAALGVSAPFVMLTFRAQAYVRYVYAALPLLSVVIGLILWRLRSSERRLYASVLGLCVVVLLANIYFLPASGFFYPNFFLNPFAPEEARTFDRTFLPVRGLVRYLNDHHPNEAVAMFETTQVGGLKGDAFVDGWHYFRYSRRVHEAPSALGYLRLVQQLGIRNFIAPRPDSGIPLSYPFIQSFLAAYTEPVYSYGAYSITRLKESLPVPSDAEVAASLPAPHACAADPAHAIDDLDAGIRYSGRWAHEIIFSAPFRGSISYSEASGADFQFTFTGSQVTWVYTQAPNRGQADVEIDGAALGTVDLYAPAIHWQSSSTFQTSPGRHTLRVRIRGEKSAAASGSYVDVDCLVGR